MTPNIFVSFCYTRINDILKELHRRRHLPPLSSALVHLPQSLAPRLAASLLPLTAEHLTRHLLATLEADDRHVSDLRLQRVHPLDGVRSDLLERFYEDWNDHVVGLLMIG